MKLISYSKAQQCSRSANSRRLADYARVRAFECVRDRVHVVDYDHVDKFFSPL
jgi:hypothetical protein